ncbi:hypothetical protein BT69DRAFT_1277017, partial [Atractiella rhizophila]
MYLEENHPELERHSPSLLIDALHNAVEEGKARPELPQYLSILAAAIGLVLALAVTQDARRFFWFWIASLLLITGVACVDITSRYHTCMSISLLPLLPRFGLIPSFSLAIAEPAPDAADGFAPWLLFWSLQNLVAFSHTTDHPEEYKLALCFLPVLTGAWFIAEILIVIRKSRRQSRSQERRCRYV